MKSNVTNLRKKKQNNIFLCVLKKYNGLMEGKNNKLRFYDGLHLYSCAFTCKRHFRIYVMRSG